MASPLATERKLIFANLLNGVTPEQVAQTFHRESVGAVMDDFRFVALKLKNYMFVRLMPAIALDNIAQAKPHRVFLLGLLDNINLDVLPQYSKITTRDLTPDSL